MDVSARGWISSPPIVAIPVFLLFVLLLWLFDTKLWRIEIFRHVFLLPDLNGKWSCAGKTRLKNGTQANYEWSAEIEIVQSWTRMSVSVVAGQSTSESIAASICHLPGRGYQLLYNYRNHPKAGESELQIHYGAAELLFDETCGHGEGHYFTDQHRSTVGTMALTRKLDSEE